MHVAAGVWGEGQRLSGCWEIHLLVPCSIGGINVKVQYFVVSLEPHEVAVWQLSKTPRSCPTSQLQLHVLSIKQTSSLWSQRGWVGEGFFCTRCLFWQHWVGLQNLRFEQAAHWPIVWWKMFLFYSQPLHCAFSPCSITVIYFTSLHVFPGRMWGPQSQGLLIPYCVCVCVCVYLLCLVWCLREREQTLDM